MRPAIPEVTPKGIGFGFVQLACLLVFYFLLFVQAVEGLSESDGSVTEGRLFVWVCPTSF
jgi:hypothetical protein